MNRNYLYSVMVLVAVGLLGCSGIDVKQPLSQGIRFSSISEGLPKTEQWKCNPAFGDVNGDGLMDIAAISRKGNGARVWINRGAESWEDASAGLVRDGSCGGGVDFADINKDGNLDLAVADHCKGLFVYTGNGQGSWTLVSEGKFPDVPVNDLALDDFNGDGHVDICACSSADSGIRIFIGSENSNWTEYSGGGFPQNGSCNEIKTADFNKDGIPDIVATMIEKPQIWMSTDGAQWRNASSDLPDLSWGGQYWGVDVGDVNADGELDLALGRIVTGPEVYLGDGQGNWQLAGKGLSEPVRSSWGVSLGDFDQDGNIDLMVSGKKDPEELGNAYGIFYFRGDGKGNWQFISDAGLPQTGLFQSWGMAGADIDGDVIPEFGGCFGIDQPQMEPESLRPMNQNKDIPPGKDFGPGGSIRVWKVVQK